LQETRWVSGFTENPLTQASTHTTTHSGKQAVICTLVHGAKLLYDSEDLQELIAFHQGHPQRKCMQPEGYFRMLRLTEGVVWP
jgi:hypothetical protein